MNRTFIYCLIEPDTGEVRYIGKADNPEQRFRFHLNDKSVCHRTNWIRSLKDRGLVPELQVVEEVRGEWPWQESERFWIAYARKQGCNLVNSTDGGDGVVNLTGDGLLRLRNAWVGRKHKQSTKDKLREIISQRRHSPSTKAKMSATHKGRKILWADKLQIANRKISDADIPVILKRLASGESNKNLSAEYGVHRTTLSKIKMGTYYGKR